MVLSVMRDRAVFTRLDGNGVFIGGYNRNLTIRQNDFEFMGASAMAAWGDTSTVLNAAGSKSVPWPIGPDGPSARPPFIAV